MSASIRARMYSAADTPLLVMWSCCDFVILTVKLIIGSPKVSSSFLRPAPSRFPMWRIVSQMINGGNYLTPLINGGIIHSATGKRLDSQADYCHRLLFDR